jgi:O-antigen ligase
MAGAVFLTSQAIPRLIRSHRLADTALCACLVIATAQLIPLPPGLRLTLAPAFAGMDRALYLDAPVNPAAGPPRPLTLDPVATMWAVAFGATLLLIFWSARAIFEREGGIRAVARGVVWCGLAVSAIAFVQRALTPRLIYGFWTPITQTAVPEPFGPFVNRNDLATWLILALPVAAGYLIARATSKGRDVDGSIDVVKVVDARAVWLAVSLCLMVALLLATTSRSGIVGAAFGVLTLWALGQRRMSWKQSAGLGVGILAVGVVAASYASIPVLTARFGEVLASDLGRGRLTIWRNTWPMARDFWLTGLGVGAFGRGMLVYQETPRLLFFNHAHNQYLQIVVEGGLLLSAAAGVALLAGWSEIVRRLRTDRTWVFWMRAGAASGIAGVLVQNFWDAGLRMPANAVLFAVALAIALHDPGRDTRHASASHES